MPGFITEEGLKELDNYKYKSGGWTWFDSKMNYFWEWTVSQVPLWVAPNLLTFIGWLFVIASYVVMLVYDYTFKKDIPSWCFFFAAICIFIYSTLDAIDGKQARRTKSSSPLGQLFDHGCDSFSITFFMLAICQAIKLEKEEVFFIFAVTQASFWISNWIEYNTGILRTKVGQFGVTEGEFTCLFVHFMTGIFGQNFWAIQVGRFLPLQIRNLIEMQWPAVHPEELKLGTVIIYFFGSLLILLGIFSIVRTLLTAKEKGRTLGQFFTLAIMLGIELIWIQLKIYQKYNGIILVNFGIIASFFVCKIIICSVTKMRLQYFHPEIIPLMLATPLMIFFNMKGNINGMIIVFWSCFAIDLVLVFRFLYFTINQLTSHLGIYCFSLKKAKKE